MSFYDSFSLWSDDSLAAEAFVSVIPDAVDMIMTSAQEQTESIQQMSSAHCLAKTTGNPSLQSWEDVANNYTLMRYTRESIYGPNTDLIGIVFAGGYGNGYENSLYVFCEAVKYLKQIHSTPDMQFVFCPHPGYSSSYEAKLFYEWGCLPDILMIPENDEAENYFSTAEVISASNASVSRCSTTGGQSLSVGM